MPVDYGFWRVWQERNPSVFHHTRYGPSADDPWSVAEVILREGLCASNHPRNLSSSLFPAHRFDVRVSGRSDLIYSGTYDFIDAAVGGDAGPLLEIDTGGLDPNEVWVDETTFTFDFLWDQLRRGVTRPEGLRAWADERQLGRAPCAVWESLLEGVLVYRWHIPAQHIRMAKPAYVLGGYRTREEIDRLKSALLRTRAERAAKRAKVDFHEFLLRLCEHPWDVSSEVLSPQVAGLALVAEDLDCGLRDPVHEWRVVYGDLRPRSRS